MSNTDRFKVETHFKLVFSSRSSIFLSETEERVRFALFLKKIWPYWFFDLSPSTKKTFFWQFFFFRKQISEKNRQNQAFFLHSVSIV